MNEAGGALPESSRRWLWSELRPNPVLALAIIAILILVLAVFVFGEHGKYTNIEVSDVLRTIAIGGIAAAITTIVDRSISFKDFYVRLESSLRQAAGIAPSLDALGVRAAHLHPFDFGQIFREVEAGETIDWLDTYCPRQNQFLQDIEDCVRRGVHVRMLVIEAGCINAKLRSEELKSRAEGGKEFDGGLAEFRRRMDRVSEEVKGSAGTFAVLTYSDLLGVPMYLIRDEKKVVRKAYFSLYLSRATGYCSHLELSKGEWLTYMSEYFDEKWTRQSSLLARPSHAIS